MKRMISILTAAALALSLGACSAQSSEAEASPSPEPTVSADELSSAQSYTGQVAQIDSQSITLTLDDGSEVSIPLTEETVFMRGRHVRCRQPQQLERLPGGAYLTK